MPTPQDPQVISLENAQGMYPLSLGRNLMTRVHDTKLSRRLATLEFRKPTVASTTLQDTNWQVTTGRGIRGRTNVGRGGNVPAAGPQLVLKVNQSNKLHKVCVNGSRVLLDEIDVQHDDIISLHGEKYKYRIIVVRDEAGAASSRNSAISAISGRSRNTGVSTSPRNVSRQLKRATAADESCETQASLGSNSATPSTRDDCTNDSDKTVQGVVSQEVGDSQTSTSTAHESKEQSSKQKSMDNVQETAFDKIRTTARQHILDEVSCTICMEILVNTHVANPCGHVFCKSCIDRIPSIQHKRYMTKSCPSCRKEITSLSWARSYDNIIWNMVLMGEIFGEGVHGEEDLNQFLIRSGKNINDLSEEQKACIFQNCDSGKKRKFNSLFSSYCRQNEYAGQRLGSHEESDDDDVVIEEPPRTIRAGQQSSMNVTQLFPGYHVAALHHNFGTEYLQGFHSSTTINGPAGTLEDPICLDD